MKILCLYNNEIALELFDWIKLSGHEVVLCSDKIAAYWCYEQSFDLTVSYTYRYILTQEIIEALNNNVVNIHNSYLPWNRGADPNIWSLLENTPRGVTLHYIDSQLDHGDIIAQVLVPSANTLLSKCSQGDTISSCENQTLASSYNDLDQAAKKLFKTAFSYYPYWNSMRKNSSQSGSYHKSIELTEFKKQIGSYDIGLEEARRRYLGLTSRKQHGGGISTE